MSQLSEPLDDKVNTTVRLRRRQREYLRDRAKAEERSEASIVRQLISDEQRRARAAA